MDEKVEEFRHLIDEADDQIIKMLEYRRNVSTLVAKHKIEKGLPAKDYEREEQLKNKYEKALGEKGVSIIEVILE